MKYKKKEYEQDLFDIACLMAIKLYKLGLIEEFIKEIDQYTIRFARFIGLAVSIKEARNINILKGEPFIKVLSLMLKNKGYERKLKDRIEGLIE